MYSTKYTFLSLFIAAALVGGALYTTSDEREVLVDNVSNNMAETVTATTFLAKNTDEKRVIIDVRTPEEYDSGRIRGSKNINFYSPTFTQEVDKLDKSKKYSVYCRSGNRSGQALALMEQLGFEDVIDLGGGVGAWTHIGQELCIDC